MSSSTVRRSPDLSAPIAMTMSISLAPSRTARRASSAFISLGMAPSGKPTTVHTTEELPARRATQRLTKTGLTHTDAKPNWAASSQSWSMSEYVASARRRVWSMKLARSLGTSPTPGAADTRHPGPTHAIIERTVSGQRVTQCPPAGHSVAPAAAQPAHVGGTRSEGFAARICVIRSTSKSKSGEDMGGELLEPAGRCGPSGAFPRLASMASIIAHAELLDHVELPDDLGIALAVAVRVQADEFAAVRYVVQAVGLHQGRGAGADIGPVLRRAGRQFRVGVLPEERAVGFAEAHQHAAVAGFGGVARRFVVGADVDLPARYDGVAIGLRAQFRHPLP